MDNGLVNDWFCFPDIVGEHCRMGGSGQGAEDRSQSCAAHDIRLEDNYH